ncbi:DUF502 domain-containing protein [Dehalogenimonas sp. 4OHTPN]|uniref:DUF502 domain-containing protein n=1 Tax=Dehalogenimonas sp. 4OHTPN TaxID=3166643 RepID=A0AAU8G9U2_9CHLR
MKRITTWFKASLKKEFLAGLLFLVPLLASVLILMWMFNTIDGILQPVIKLFFGREIVGLGLAGTIVLIWIVGIIWHNVVGRSILKTADQVFSRLPVFSQIYTGAKQVVDSLGGVKRSAFKEVVIVDFPQKGVKSLAFITNDMEDENGKKIYVVYVPGSPNPTSGFLQLLREHQISRPNMSVDCAMRMIISCGMVTPEKCQGVELADGADTDGGTPAPADEGSATAL